MSRIRAVPLLLAARCWRSRAVGPRRRSRRRSLPQQPAPGARAAGRRLHEPHPLHEIDRSRWSGCRWRRCSARRSRCGRKRRGTPPRTPAVIQTQIILAIVGAVIMLVVGASLARAFGIVGAANLIRYRSKIDDPKDAVVMLCALAVGLASGVGLYALAVFSTVFIVAALWVIESFEPRARSASSSRSRRARTPTRCGRRSRRSCSRYQLEFELRTSSDEEVCYDVQVPLELQTDRVTNAILQLDPEGHAAVEWAEKKKQGAK